MTALEDTPAPLRWPPVEPLRDGYGRYAGAKVDDVEKGWSNPRSRVTTITGRLEDRFNIERWLWEKIGLGLAKSSDHYELLCEYAESEDGKGMRAFMERMGELGGSTEAADRGTRYHELIAISLAGGRLPSDVTLEEKRDIKAVVKLLIEAGIVVVDLERILVNKGYDYAGTADYRMVVPGIGTVIGDLKTGSRLDLSYGGYRAQLAAYANATHEVDDEGELVEITTPTDRDLGLIVHIVPGSADPKLVGVDLVAGWRAFRLAHRVWTHGRGRPRPMSFEEGMVHWASRSAERDAARSSWCRTRIDVIRTIKSDPTNTGMKAIKYLQSTWPPGVPTPSQTEGWTGDDLLCVIAAVEITEKAFEAPFPPKDPTK